MKIFLKFLLRMILSIMFICFFNSFENVLHCSIGLNLFNIVIIALFDVYGIVACLFIKYLL